MRKRNAAVRVAILGTAAIALAGCGGPYRIRDTGTADTTYYAKSYKKHRDGTISFTDARTGAKVTLQSSMIEEIPQDEWRGAVKD